MKNLSDIPAIILAGGLGTRIREAEPILPKPLIKVGKYNLLEHNILRLRKAGVRKIIISLSYKSIEIQSYFGDGKKYDVELSYCEEPNPLGDAGAFKYTYKNQTSERVLFVNSDEIRQGLNLEEMLLFHDGNNSISTVALIEKSDIQNHGIFELDQMGRATKFLMKPSKSDTSSIYANSGLYIVEREALNYFPNGISMMKDILPSLVSSNNVFGYIFNGVYFNVGTPEILSLSRTKIDELEDI